MIFRAEKTVYGTDTEVTTGTATQYTRVKHGASHKHQDMFQVQSEQTQKSMWVNWVIFKDI